MKDSFLSFRNKQDIPHAYCRESIIMCLVARCYYNLHMLKIIQAPYADLIKSVDICMNDYYSDNL